MHNNIIQETCAKCQGCCNSLQIPILKDSKVGKLILDIWEKEENFPEGHELSETKNKPDFWIYDSNKKPCLFLDKGNCKVQNFKPIICRTYPLKWANQHHYYIDLCPLAFVIPLKEIYSWKDGHKEEITKAIGYVDNSKHSQQNEFNNLEQLIPISRIIYERNSIKELFEIED